MLHSKASDLGLHCFQLPFWGVSWLKWVTLRKQAYSNILKILPPTKKMKIFRKKKSYIFYISAEYEKYQ